MDRNTVARRVASAQIRYRCRASTVRRVPVVFLVLLLTACGSTADEDGESGAGSGSPDAGVDGGVGGDADRGAEGTDETDLCLVADQSAGVEIGRCIVAGTGTDCTGATDEDEVFVPLEPGDTVRIVTGFQGARMFNFSVRAGGIASGAPDDPNSDTNPIVEVRVHRTSYSVVGRFRGRVVFRPDLDDPDMMTGSDLFVLLDSVVPVDEGQTLTAVASIRDADGDSWCGTLEFVVDG